MLGKFDSNGHSYIAKSDKCNFFFSADDFFVK